MLRFVGELGSNKLSGAFAPRDENRFRLRLDEDVKFDLLLSSNGSSDEILLEGLEGREESDSFLRRGPNPAGSESNDMCIRYQN